MLVHGVEGAEPDVITTIDFEKITIDVLIAENVNSFCKKNEECEARTRTRSYMTQKHGYLLYSDVVKRSDLYVHPHSQLTKAFRALQQ